MSSQSTRGNQSPGATSQEKMDQLMTEAMAEYEETQKQMGPVTYMDGSTNQEEDDLHEYDQEPGPDKDKALANITKMIRAHQQGGDKAMEQALHEIRGDTGSPPKA